MPDQYYEDAETRLSTRLGRIRREQEQRKREELAAQGAGYGGRRTAAMGQIEREISTLQMQGTEALERNRMAMEESQRGRTWQTGERTGSEAHQMGFQKAGFAGQAGLAEQAFGHDIGRMGVGFGYQTQLQGQAEKAKMQLQMLVQSGQMTVLEAEQAWQGIQADLARQQETGMQATAIVQEQWTAQFGQDAAMKLQGAAQAFEQFLVQQGRDWELDDREWNSLMWMMDAQLQMLVAGYDWNDDGYIGGAPNWVFEEGEFGPGYAPGEGPMYSGAGAQAATGGGATAGGGPGGNEYYMGGYDETVSAPTGGGGGANAPYYDAQGNFIVTVNGQQGYYDAWGNWVPI